ncbi:hypothetical protein BASA81_000326 [Batrachochytrium salamandrivorans]|nr:hypothetical protein BASA81_000326 [Batrachochytrium salamandrivorans]
MAKPRNAFDDFDGDDVFEGVDVGDSFETPPPPPSMPPPPMFDSDDEEEEDYAKPPNRMSQRYVAPDSFAPKRAPPPPSVPPPPDSDEDEDEDYGVPAPPPYAPPSAFSDDEEDNEEGYLASSPHPPPPPAYDDDDEVYSTSEEEGEELNTSGRSMPPPPPPPVTVTSDEEEEEEEDSQAQEQAPRRVRPSFSVSSEEDLEMANLPVVIGRPAPPAPVRQPQFPPPPPPPMDSEDEDEPAFPPPPPPALSDDDEDDVPLVSPQPLPPVDSEEEEEEFPPPVFVQTPPLPPAGWEGEEDSDDQEPFAPIPVVVGKEEEEETPLTPPFVPTPTSPPRNSDDDGDAVGDDDGSEEERSSLPPNLPSHYHQPTAPYNVATAAAITAQDQDELSSIEAEPELLFIPIEDKLLTEQQTMGNSPLPMFESSFVPVVGAIKEEETGRLSPILAPVDVQRQVRRGSTSHVPSSFFDPSSSSSEGEDEEEPIPPPFPPPPQDSDDEDNDEQDQNRTQLVEENYSSKALSLTTRPSTTTTGQQQYHRTLAQYALWINSLRIWSKLTQVEELCDAMKSGVLLCRLVDKLSPSNNSHHHTLVSKLLHNHHSPTKQMCLENIDLALDRIWQLKVNAGNMPHSSSEVYLGDPIVLGKLLGEMFLVLGLPTAQQKLDMYDWYEGVLGHYEYTLPDSLTLPPHRNAFESFYTADALLCVLHFFCGPQGTREFGLPAVDLNRVCRDPERAGQIKSNIRELFDVLDGIDSLSVPWTAKEFALAQDQDMLLVQLHTIFKLFQSRPCALPLLVPGAATTVSSKGQYVVVGAHGEMRVMGVSFLLGELEEAENLGSAAQESTFIQPPPSSVFDIKLSPKHHQASFFSSSKEFFGFHSFSSLDLDRDRDMGFHSGSVVTEGEISGEVFFLKGAFHTPMALPEAMNQSAMESMDRALSTSHHNDGLQLATRSIRGGGDFASSQVVREKMRQRVAQLDGSRGGRNGSVDAEKRAQQEREAMQAEDERRREQLKRESKPVRRHSSGTTTGMLGNDKVQVAFDWLQVQRDVRFHYRNRKVSVCRLFVSLDPKLGYKLEWFDIKQPSQAGQVPFSGLDSIQTSGEEEDSFYLYLHLKAPTSSSTTGGGGVLRIEPPPNKQHDALRMFTNLSILLEDSKSGRANARPNIKARGEEF